MFSNLKKLLIMVGISFIFLIFSFWLLTILGFLVYPNLMPVNGCGGQPALIFCSFDFVQELAFIGFVLCVIGGLSQYFRIRKLAQGKPFELSSVQHRCFESTSSLNVMFEACITALEKSQATILEKNMSEYFIKAQIFNRQIFNSVRIDITRLENSRTQVKIVCRPVPRIRIFDNGANYEIAEKLLSYLR